MNSVVRNSFVRIGLVLSFVVAILLLTVVPAFATASNQALQSVTAGIQEAANSQVPMTLEEGVEFLSASTNLTAVEVSAGLFAGHAILSDGTLWSWGRGGQAATGLGNTTDVLVPTQVGTANTWTSIQSKQNSVIAQQSDGTLWGWGSGTSNGKGVTTSVPTQIQPGSTWEAFSMGGMTGAAIRSDGTLWVWGHLPAINEHLTPTPIQVGNLTTWKDVAAGHYVSAEGYSSRNHFLALQNNGTLWSWGGNGAGELGLGDRDHRFDTLTQVGSLTTWESISAGGGISKAIQSNGTLWSWGLGIDGRTGQGDTNTRLVPTQVGTATTWESVTAGGGAGIGMQSDGTLWTWGHGIVGSLGQGDFNNRYVPTQVQPGTTWNSVSTGILSTVAAIQNNGTLWSWGLGVHGQTGLGVTGITNTPNLVHAQVSSSTPAANATNVAHSTNSITLTFNRVMDEDFGTITVSGAIVNMAGATWTHGTNTSTLTVPITLTLPGGNTHVVTAPGLLNTPGGFAAAGVDAPNAGPGAFPAFGHTFSFTTETGALPMQDTLTKTLRLPAGTTIPTLAFNFTFTPVQVALRENPTVNSAPAASVPAIATQTISFNSSSTSSDNAGIRTSTGSVNLFNLVDALTFPNAGTFVWNIEEVQTTPVVTTPSYLDFSQARYEMRVLVDNDLEVVAIELFVRVIDTHTYPAQTVGNKVEVAHFTNTYTTTVANPLSVQKLTTGQFANHNLDFNFTLTLTNPVLGGPIGTITANVVAVNAPNTTLRTVPITAGANTFALSHNERLVIPTLPAGTTFRVSEAAAPEYRAGAVVVIGGVAQGSPPAPTYQNAYANTVLETGIYTIASQDVNSVHFTNAHQFAPPTGLAIGGGAPFALLAVMTTALLVLRVAGRARKRIEELPIV